MAYPLLNQPVCSSYYKLRAQLSEGGVNYDIFIGEIDDEFHLLGYRPKQFAYLFPEVECASQDMGTVALPSGRKELSDLVAGDELEITYESNGSKNTWVYLGSY